MRIPTSLASSLLVLAASCSVEESRVPQTPASSVPARFWSGAEPAEARSVSAVHAAAQDGEHVVLVGAVGGAAKVFVDGAAVFTLVDLELRDCVGDGMGCRTPWDYCCVDPQALRRGTATIELREEGRLVPASPRGFHGLDHHSVVVVEGRAERDPAGNLVVAAERLHVRP